MSIFRELGIPSGLVSYCVMQQLDPASDIGEFRNQLGDAFHKTLTGDAALREAYAAALGEARNKAAQVARGSLNQFLSTPIKSDNEDVQRIIKDALERYSEQILPSQTIGIQAAWYSQMVSDSSIVSARTKLSVIVRKMLSAGKRILGDLGFDRGKGLSNIFENVFLIESGMNLDTLESTMQKSMTAIVAPQTVKHSWNGMHNVLSVVGIAGQTTGLWDAALYPRAADIERGEYLKMIENIFTDLSKEFNLHHLSLWGKKFSSLRDNHYIVRIRMIPDHKLFLEIVKWLSASGGDAARRGLIEESGLVVKEILS